MTAHIKPSAQYPHLPARIKAQLDAYDAMPRSYSADPIMPTFVDPSDAARDAAVLGSLGTFVTAHLPLQES